VVRTKMKKTFTIVHIGSFTTFLFKTKYEEDRKVRDNFLTSYLISNDIYSVAL